MTESAFRFLPTESGTELQLELDGIPISFEQWEMHAPRALLSGVELAQRLIASDSAIYEGTLLIVEHVATAGLTAHEASCLGLTDLTNVRAVVEGRGMMVKPGFRATLQWQRPNGQPVMGTERLGAWLRIGQKWNRLPASLYQIAEAVDQINRAPDDDSGERLAAIAALREVLPVAEENGVASAKGLLGRVTIVHAESFSLDVQGEGEQTRLVPLLYHSATEKEEPVLSGTQQQFFADELFFQFSAARPIYTLGEGVYVVLTPPLRRALGEVRRIANAPLATRHAFLQSPRAFLQEVLEDDLDSTVIENIFRESPQWSRRVTGLGLWERRVLPWIPLPSNDWFGPEEGLPHPQNPPVGIIVDDVPIPLDLQAIKSLWLSVQHAMGQGIPAVDWPAAGKEVAIPANSETLSALRNAEIALTRWPQPKTHAQPREVVQILPNETNLEVEDFVSRRRGPEKALPEALVTLLKQHQSAGICWFQRCWESGLPGVLLADDMGLGKTLQALAFLTWLREGMAWGKVPRAPILIVAPTGLLENWSAEHSRHLAAPGLGSCLRAYGKGLSSLRTKTTDDRPRLNAAKLKSADWVLTTYETVRDYDRDFIDVEFAAVVFDEAQKIKTPGVRLTDAAKALNAEFKIALTGTPVENRLADLWCIVDTVYSGCLSDLKSFSERFEKDLDESKLKLLKSSLDVERHGRPPLLLRRLKEDQLPDLPDCAHQIHRSEMRGDQLAAYLALIDTARGRKRRGAVLGVLQELLKVSLHHLPAQPLSDEDFVNSSARLRVAFAALDEVAARKERVLVFLNDLQMQAKLVGIIQRRYQLQHPPMVINGTVPGPTRQHRVDAFQESQNGFDVMLLSPRAGGVGLTLTSANHVIHLSRWWNPAIEDQSTARVLRIGQTRPVNVHIPIATLPDGRRSFDENLHALLERKRLLSRDALMPPFASEREQEELLIATLEGA
jgi:hypothetical protein